jgi:RNA polymerase sigma-70 factor (ECF subfamily)
MIKSPRGGHWSFSSMSARELERPRPVVSSAEGGAASPDRRLRRLVDQHYDFVWRTLRYLGVPDAGVEDAAQQVLCVLARRLQDVSAGAEVSFLFNTAVRVAKDVRRSAQRRPATPSADIDAFAAPGPNPEELLDERRARDTLHEVLGSIPEDQRMVFVLYEIEELTMAEIARLLAIAPGTAASRLRKAREVFQSLVARRRASARHPMRGRRE